MASNPWQILADSRPNVGQLLGAYEQGKQQRLQQLLVQQQIADHDRAIQAGSAIANVIRAYGSTRDGSVQPSKATTDTASPISATPSSAPPAPTSILPSIASSTGATAPIAASTSPAVPGSAAPSASPAAPTPQAATGSILDPSHPATQSLGAAVSSGQLPLHEAIAQAYQYGAQYGDKAVDSLSKLNEFDKARIAEQTQALGSVAQQALKIPDDPTHAARRQFVMSQLPQLQQHGITPDQVNGADLSDNGLNGRIGQAIGVQATLEQANKDRDFGQKQAELAETSRHNLATEQQAGVKVLGPGEVAVDTTGGGSASPSGGGTVALSGNNPGGIIDGKFASTQPGYAGANGRYASFKTMQDGVNAQTALLNSYVSRGFDTPAKIAARWAPKGDGNNDPTAYAAGIAKTMGIGVNDKIGPSQIGAFQRAQALQENASYGSKAPAGPRVIASNTQSAIDDPTVEFYAQKVAAGGDLPQLGMGQAAAMARQKILQRAAQIQSGQGITGGASNAIHAGVKADASSLQSLEKQATIIRAAEGAAQRNGSLALSLSAQVGNGNVPIFNAWKNAGGRATGDPHISSFNAAVDTFVNEYAKVMGGGTPTDALRAHAHDVLNTAQSPAQFKGVMTTLSKDMENRRVALESERQSTLSRISGAGGNSGGLPSGATKTATGPGGKKVALVNGQWVPF